MRTVRRFVQRILCKFGQHYRDSHSVRVDKDTYNGVCLGCRGPMTLGPTGWELTKS